MENPENERDSAGTSSAAEDESWFSQFRHGSNPWMARYIYAFMFLVVNMLAWAVRDYGRLEDCEGGKDCLGAQGVLRVSLGCFTFYVIMFLSTVGTSKLQRPREQWHSCWWIAKICLWVTLIILSSLIPPSIVAVYGELAHFGAGAFLLIQLVSIISFITWLNDFFLSEKYADRCHIHLILSATISYATSFVGIIMMYIWYAPQPSCLINIFFITWTLILLQLMISVSLHPKVNAGILPPGLLGLYIVYNCWAGIRSEPPDESCGRKTSVVARTDWLTIISFVVAVLTIVIATFSTGIDSRIFKLRKDPKKEEEEEEEEDVPYGYGFFHFVFATGAMYFAMLLIGWNSHHAMRKWTIDVGWTSTWVRIVNEWLAVCAYIWMVVAPAVWKSRPS